MYRFLLKPRWILSHLLIATVAVAFICLGFWQLRRLDDRRATNAEVKAAEAEAPVALEQLLPTGPSSTSTDVDAVDYRLATVSGAYRVDQQVLVPNRTYESAPGYWVLTPLVLDDGSAVVINRGWIPFSYTEEGPWTDFDPPTGRVTVTGMVRPPQVRDSQALVGGPQDAADGTLRSLARVDVGRLQQQVDETLYPLYLNLEQQSPAQDSVVGPTGATIPVPVPRPPLDEGPHFSYAMQWFFFALLAIVGYPLGMRWYARRRLQGDPDDAPLVDVDRVDDPAVTGSH